MSACLENFKSWDSPFEVIPNTPLVGLSKVSTGDHPLQADFLGSLDLQQVKKMPVTEKVKVVNNMPRFLRSLRKISNNNIPHAPDTSCIRIPHGHAANSNIAIVTMTDGKLEELVRPRTRRSSQKYNHANSFTD
jgi:hypothetical protein